MLCLPVGVAPLLLPRPGVVADFPLLLPGIATEPDGPVPVPVPDPDPEPEAKAEPEAAAGAGLGKMGLSFDPVVVLVEPVD
jgi:hypothetical protein